MQKPAEEDTRHQPTASPHLCTHTGEHAYTQANTHTYAKEDTGEELVWLFVLVFTVVGGPESTEIEQTFLSEYTRNGVFVLQLYKVKGIKGLALSRSA